MNILKKLRDKTNLTQEAVATELNVTVNTVQNWERTGRITKESLHQLLDLYKVSSSKRDEVVLTIFGDDREVEKENAVDNFPEFLFADRPDVVATVRNAVLPAEEMELFGYAYYMWHCCSGEYGYGPKHWPIEYAVFEKYGGYFATQKTIENIKEKIGDYTKVNKDDYYSNGKGGICEAVYEFGVNNPGKGFSFVKLPKKVIIEEIGNLCNLADVDIYDLYKQCKLVKKPVRLDGKYDDGWNSSSVSIAAIVALPDRSYSFDRIKEHAYELKLDEISNQCFTIIKKEHSDSVYLAEKEQYRLDRKAYDEHPNLYEREPSFDYEFDYWLELTEIGRQYIEWMES